MGINLISRLYNGHYLYFQGVQEGMILISRLYSGHDLYFQGVQEGMIFSDEPGYYEAGSFGIRLENLVQVTKAETKYSFNGR